MRSCKPARHGISAPAWHPASSPPLWAVAALTRIGKPFTVLLPPSGSLREPVFGARSPAPLGLFEERVMDVTKWTAALLGIASIVGGGCCCNQPGSWGNWGGGTYAPPPAQPVYQQPYAAPVYGGPGTGPVTSAPMTTAPMTSAPPQ